MKPLKESTTNLPHIRGIAHNDWALVEKDFALLTPLHEDTQRAVSNENVMVVSTARSVFGIYYVLGGKEPVQSLNCDLYPVLRGPGYGDSGLHYRRLLGACILRRAAGYAAGSSHDGYWACGVTRSGNRYALFGSPPTSGTALLHDPMPDRPDTMLHFEFAVDTRNGRRIHLINGVEVDPTRVHVMAGKIPFPVFHDNLTEAILHEAANQ